MSEDPFGTEALRAAVLAAWRDSPTRFTEDTNAERDLRVGGYRDRLFVELAQNAADAAAVTGTPGTVRVTVVSTPDGRAELRVANTGAPLDTAGVAALSSLRASAKSAGTVGRFGVGFAAVLAVTEEPRVVSRSGGVAFSAARTRDAAGRTGEVPVLRLPWPVPEDEPAPPEGFDTEVRLPLTGADADTLLPALAAGAEDLLLALPWLARLEIGEEVWTRSDTAGLVRIDGPDGRSLRWRSVTGDGVTWAVPLDQNGAPAALPDEVLHAPTPTDERLSLPARLIAAVPVEPNRRRVLPGPEVHAVLAAAAARYPELVRALPVEHRPELVPGGGFPLSEVDEELRGLVLRALADSPWLPAADGGEVTGAGARVLAVRAPELPALLAGTLPGLLAAPLCGPAVVRALAPAGVDQVGVAELVEALTGLDRPPRWWRELYRVLAEVLDAHGVDAGELGGLPVPLADGRTLPGPRGALLFGADDELLESLAEAGVIGLRLVHPDAAHPLLERLGAHRAGPVELLQSPALLEAVERSVPDALSGVDTSALADAVLRLLAAAGARPGADPGGLEALALPCAEGWRRAAELVLPSAPLLEVLDPDALGEGAPLSLLDKDFAEQWPVSTLTALGALDGFAVLEVEDPAGPEHDLPEETDWWDSLATPPHRVLAVRDLDLVADEAWPAALRLLAGQPRTWAALTTPGGHTGWWLARYALLDGRPPIESRLPDAAGLAGLYDPLPDLGLGPELLAAAGVRAGLTVVDREDAADLLDRLGDPQRTVAPGLAMRAYAALAASGLDPEEVEPPERVRAVDATVAEAADCVVLDVPWPAQVLPANGLVAAPEGLAGALAELLDLPLAGQGQAQVCGAGEYVPWAEQAAVCLVADLLGLDLPPGGVLLHERLLVRVDGREHPVDWWQDGRLHAEDSPAGLARALAWALDRWADRQLITALLDDPEAVTLLR